MTQEQLRMQMLAGIITESEYKAKLDEKYGENYDLGIGDSFIVKYKPEGECRPRGYEDLEIGDKITLTKKWSNIQDIIFGTDWPSANIPGKDYIDGLSTDQISLLRGLGSCDPNTAYIVLKKYN
jgi:hypothetical protein